jgi:hypothetical protein
MYRPPAHHDTAVRRAALALALLSLTALAAWMPVTKRAGSVRTLVPMPDRLPPCTPSRRALLESAFWWSQAVQVANDEYDDERASLQAWDPAVRSVDWAEQRRLLARDSVRYLQRAQLAARRAAELARTALERHRTAWLLAELARAADGRPVDLFVRASASRREARGRSSRAKPPTRKLY